MSNMKGLRAYLKSKKSGTSGQPSSGGNANAKLNQPAMGNSANTGKKGQEALSVSKLKPNAGKSGDFGTKQKGTLADEAVHGSSKSAAVKQDGNQKGFNWKGPNPNKNIAVSGASQGLKTSPPKKTGTSGQTGNNPKGPNTLKNRSSNTTR